MNKLYRAATLCLTILVVAACSANKGPIQTSGPDEASLLNNVSYRDVLSQDFNEPLITMRYGADPLQFGQLWLPNKSHNSNDAPLVIFIHGGCWLNAYDIKHSYPMTSALADQGFLVWSLEYRRTGDEGGGWPGSFDDIIRGIRFIKEQSVYPINTRDVVLTGHSAGGHLALLASSELADNEINGVIGLAAIVDINTYSQGDNSCQQAGPQFMGGDIDEIPDLYTGANPVQQTLHPTSLLLQGRSDTIVPVTQTTNTSLPQIVLEGVGHFDWIHPHTRAFNLLVSQLNEMLNR